MDTSVVKAFAPTGVLRAAINTGNPILTAAGKEGGEPEGVSVDLASAFAEFMVIQQALGTPKSRGATAADVLRDFVEDMAADSLPMHNSATASKGRR